MKKRESAKRATRSGRLRRHNRLRRLHRWFGLASLLFILVLSLTGLGLNHAEDWGLDERYIAAPWLMAWYGFEMPRPTVSYAVGARRVTLVGNRLYVDADEAARGIDDVVGAVAWDDLVIVATPESLLYIDENGQLLDRIELGLELPGDIEAVGRLDGELAVASGLRIFVFDERTLETAERHAGSTALLAPEPSPVPDPLLAAIAGRYRGPGISLERLLYDLHNGSLFRRAGTWFLDAAGLLLVVLSVTGLVLWVKRRG